MELGDNSRPHHILMHHILAALDDLDEWTQERSGPFQFRELLVRVGLRRDSSLMPANIKEKLDKRSI